MYSQALPRRIKHMAKDGQVYFHRRFFANPVKPQRCNTEPVKPLDGTNKDVSVAKLQLHNNHICLSCGLCLFLSLTEDTALLMKAVTCLRLPTHPHQKYYNCGSSKTCLTCRIMHLQKDLNAYMQSSDPLYINSDLNTLHA